MIVFFLVWIHFENCFSERRAMFDMMNELRLGFKALQQELEEERRARRQLESQIQRLLTVTTGKWFSSMNSFPFFFLLSLTQVIEHIYFSTILFSFSWFHLTIINHNIFYLMYTWCARTRWFQLSRFFMISQFVIKHKEFENTLVVKKQNDILLRPILRFQKQTWNWITGFWKPIVFSDTRRLSISLILIT